MSLSVQYWDFCSLRLDSGCLATVVQHVQTCIRAASLQRRPFARTTSTSIRPIASTAAILREFAYIVYGAYNGTLIEKSSVTTSPG
jgi:hypothetical protein